MIFMFKIDFKGVLMPRQREKLNELVAQYRHTNYPIAPLFLNRWSPRAMSGNPITDQDLMMLFEAARWAPSSYNAQPWRFMYAKREGPHWEKFFNLLDDFNKSWCINASVLVVIASRKNFEYNEEPAPTHAFDAGAAWENLALQSSLAGFIAHGMQGFDYERAHKELGVPDVFGVYAMFAIGLPAPMNTLPPGLQKKEFPSDRKPLNEIVFNGQFGTP